MSQFTFDPELHLYRNVAGEWKPSVTQIISAQGLSPDLETLIAEEVLSRKSRIGTAVHRLTDVFDLTGIEPTAELTYETEGFYQSWIGFRRITGFVPEAVSLRNLACVNGVYFGMELDKMGILGRSRAILDLKCSLAKPAAWGYQTAAYEMGVYSSARCGRVIRGAVALNEDGAPGKLIEYTDHSNDAQQFLCALVNATERIRIGTLREPQGDLR